MARGTSAGEASATSGLQRPLGSTHPRCPLDRHDASGHDLGLLEAPPRTPDLESAQNMKVTVKRQARVRTHAHATYTGLYTHPGGPVPELTTAASPDHCGDGDSGTHEEALLGP